MAGVPDPHCGCLVTRQAGPSRDPSSEARVVVVGPKGAMGGVVAGVCEEGESGGDSYHPPPRNSSHRPFPTIPRPTTPSPPPIEPVITHVGSGGRKKAGGWLPAHCRGRPSERPWPRPEGGCNLSPANGVGGARADHGFDRSADGPIFDKAKMVKRHGPLSWSWNLPYNPPPVSEKRVPMTFTRPIPNWNLSFFRNGQNIDGTKI